MIAKMTVRNLLKTNDHLFLSVVERIPHSFIKKSKIIDNRHFFSKFTKTDHNLYPKYLPIWLKHDYFSNNFIENRLRKFLIFIEKFLSK
jgi:hypothetical protein